MDRRASDFFPVGLTSGTGRSSVGCSRGSVLATLLSDDTEIIQSIPCFVRVGFIACHSAFPAATTARWHDQKKKKHPEALTPTGQPAPETPLGPADNLAQWVNLTVIRTWLPDKDIQKESRPCKKNPTSHFFFNVFSEWKCKIIHLQSTQCDQFAESKTRKAAHPEK